MLSSQYDKLVRGQVDLDEARARGRRLDLHLPGLSVEESHPGQVGM